MVSVAEVGMWAAAIGFTISIVIWSYRKRRIIPFIVLLPAITQYIWFIQAAYMSSFQEFVPMFHSLQYMLIAWGMQLSEKLETKQIAPSRRYALFETTRWGALNIAGGTLLFFALPQLFVLFGYSQLFCAGVINAGIQIHHFFVDGVIWKLRRKSVAHPLMMNIQDVTGRRPLSAAGS
jgi:hypothetical protein